MRDYIPCVRCSCKQNTVYFKQLQALFYLHRGSNEFFFVFLGDQNDSKLFNVATGFGERIFNPNSEQWFGSLLLQVEINKTPS